MVTEEKIISHLVLRYRFGTILIWLGVFIWAPFILLKAIGASPQFLLFLPFHLIGVVGGSQLRSAARRDLGIQSPAKNILHLAGHALILLGILAWAPYLYLKLVMKQAVEVTDILPFHLTGVLGGVFLHVLSYLRKRRQENR